MAVAGRVLMIPAGNWTSGKNYGMLDVVIHGGSSFVAKKQINNSTVIPSNDTGNWQLLAQGFDVTNVVTKSMIANNFLATDPNTVLSGPMGKSLKDQLDTTNSNLALKSIGNAIAGTGWEVTASNVTINNSFGILYGKMKFVGNNAPVWGDTIGNFPNYHSSYTLPLLLFRTNGDLYLTASVGTGGVIKVYNPDITKIVTGAEFHFQASYVVG